MESIITREAAWELLRKYNKDPFHLQHALTVEGVMRWYAEQLGYASEVDFWGMVGLLHDIDFELFPEEHCIKATELLREGGVGEEMIHAICSHGYGITVDVKPEHLMADIQKPTARLRDTPSDKAVNAEVWESQEVESGLVIVRLDLDQLFHACRQDPTGSFGAP